MTNKSNTVGQNIGSLEENFVFSCGYTTNPDLPNYSYEFIIPYYSCFIVLDGFGSYQDESGLHALLSRGILVQRFPNTSHHISIDSSRPWESFYLTLAKNSYEVLVSLGVLNTKEPVKKIHITKELLLLLDELSYEFTNNKENKFILHQKITECIYNMLTQTALAPSLSTVITKAKEILQCNFSIVYTEKDICDLLCIGQESFRKLFKKEVGISPIAYRNQQRMLAAKKLLASQSSIAEIAEALGYSDSFSFSKQFKRHWGYSPNAFRKTLSL
jgi:AraC-like DNA-binding protein